MDLEVNVAGIWCCKNKIELNLIYREIQGKYKGKPSLLNQCWILGVHFTAYGCICVIVPVFVVIKHAFDQLWNHSVDTTSETSLVCLIRPLQGIQRTYTPSTYKETQTHTKTVTYSLVETHTQKHAQLNLNVYDVISFLLCHGSMISGCSNVNCH